MKAERFYQLFEAEFAPAAIAEGFKKLAGKTSKWKATLPVGSLTFSCATNSKTAGLLPHLPGEFRLLIDWSVGKGSTKRHGDVSWFQYTSEAEDSEFAAIERAAFEKFLAQPGKERLRIISNYANDPTWRPRPNYTEFASYFDEHDVTAWGQWYGSALPTWLRRFSAAPELRSDWCDRVLRSKPSTTLGPSDVA